MAYSDASTPLEKSDIQEQFGPRFSLFFSQGLRVEARLISLKSNTAVFQTVGDEVLVEQIKIDKSLIFETRDDDGVTQISGAIQNCFYHNGIIALKVLLPGLDTKVRDFLRNEIQKLDSSEIPEIKPKLVSNEARAFSRIPVRQGEGMKVTLELAAGTIIGRAFDLSSHGLGILTKTDGKLKVGDNVHALIHINKTYTSKKDSVVKSIRRLAENTYKIGLAFNEMNHGTSFSPRLMLDRSSYIYGVLYKEFFFLERCVFKITALSGQYIMLKILDKETVLLKGMEISLKIFLETDTKNSIQGTVESVYSSSNGELNVLLRDIVVPKALERNLVRYLMHVTTYSPQHLRDLGFKTQKISNTLKFKTITNYEEYLKVLQLRLSAYERANKVSQNSTIKNMSSKLDKVSRILAAFHHQEIIASVALTFPSGKEILDTEAPLESGYPDWFPKKSEVIEISRLCVDHRYRKSDVLFRMFQHIYRIMQTSDRKYLITSTDENLLKIYKKIGMRETGIFYSHPVLKGIEHQILIGNIQTGVSAWKIGLFSWLVLYAGVNSYLERNEANFQRPTPSRFGLFVLVNIFRHIKDRILRSEY